MKLIDEYTEYFRSHLEVLPKSERRVYLAVLDLWRPSSTGEITARARMDVRTVSTMLGRLVNRGAVIAEGRGKKRLYAATERLHSIYYKLRRERDEAAVIANLIRFMAVFYSNTELAEMSGKLIAEATRLPTIREGIERAITEQPQLGHLFPSMHDQALIGPLGLPRQSITRASNNCLRRLLQHSTRKHSRRLSKSWTKPSLLEAQMGLECQTYWSLWHCLRRQRTINAASLRQRLQPTTKYSHALAPATNPTFKSKSLRLCS